MASCTVIVPCYNGARFLPDTIASVLGQTIVPGEIIVVDDGSTDDSADVAARMGTPVRVIRQRNQGESVARNVGLAAATGDYVLFLDADDLLAPESLARLAAAVAAHPGAVAVMGSALFTDDPAVPFERYIPQHTSFFPTIVQTNLGPPHCWYLPRELAVRVGGFREDLINSEDWEFWGRIALTGAQLVSVPYEGALYRRHPQSQVATSPKPAIYRGRLLVCETLAAAILERPALLNDVGHELFWSLWAMLGQARRGGVRPAELRGAETLLREIARRGPPVLRRSVFGMAVRHLGVRAADGLRRLVITSPGGAP
jgi:glycosyltransferase involved in cell wall biosynthesis